LPVSVTLDPTRVAPGPLRKSVFVYVDGQTIPSAVLGFKGEASTGVTMDLPSLDFGDVKSGSAASRSITVKFDTSLLGTGVTPKLSVSSSDIQVGEPKEVAGGRVYPVSIARTAALGSLSASFGFLDAAHPAKTYASIPIVAHVTGPLTASAEMIVFGGVSFGKGADVDLTFSGPASSGKLSAECDNKYVSIRIDGGAIPKLHASLKTDAPKGLLQADVIVKTATGVRLALPVVADVVGG